MMTATISRRYSQLWWETMIRTERVLFVMLTNRICAEVCGDPRECTVRDLALLWSLGAASCGAREVRTTQTRHRARRSLSH